MLSEPRELCFICGRMEEIEKHHLISRQSPYPYNRIIYICQKCHSAIHEYKSRGNISELIKLGLERTKLNGKKLGRPFGSKDKNQRNKIGYYKRWLSPRLKEKYDKNL